MGYELVALELQPGGNAQVLRAYIDRPEGITIDDCERVSRQLSALLDVEEPLRGDYTLEVSSPGADRLLTRREHFVRYVGDKVRIRLRMARDGRRHLTGTIAAVMEEGIELKLEDVETAETVLFESIDRARLVPDFG